MSVPIIGGVIAVLIIVLLATTARGGRGTPTAAGRQTGVIVLALVVVAGLVLYAVFGRR